MPREEMRGEKEGEEDVERGRGRAPKIVVRPVLVQSVKQRYEKHKITKIAKGLVCIDNSRRETLSR